MNGKPSWTGYLCVLTYCAVAILALNSYQERFKPVSSNQQQIDERPIAPMIMIADNQQAQPETNVVQTENTQVIQEPSPEANFHISQPIAAVPVDNTASSYSNDSELLGSLAADFARSAMKEGSIVLPRQIVQQPPQRSAPPMKLASFRLPRSTAKIEPPRPASMLVNYQSRLLTVTTDVQARMATYLRWVRFCTTVRGLISDFEKSYLQPVFDRLLNRQPADKVLFDVNAGTYDMMRYAVPIAYPG